MGGEDGSRVAALVEEMNDAAGSPKQVQGLFAAGAKPASPKGYAKFSYSVSGKPSVSGDSATCKVRVDAPDGTKVGEPEWAFARDSSGWKIKEAPLP